MIHLNSDLTPKEKLKKLWLYYRYSNKDQTNLFDDTLISYKYDTSNPMELSKNVEKIKDQLEDYFLLYYESIDLSVELDGSQLTIQLRVKEKDHFYDLYEVLNV